MASIEIDEKDALVLLSVAMTLSDGESDYAMFALITAIVQLIETLEIDLEFAANEVANAIKTGRQHIKKDKSCPPN